MKALRWYVFAAMMLAVTDLRAACTWPAWEQFKQDYMSEGGRVIDPSDARKITTSEGQSYGLFFALVANDRKAFDQLLSWDARQPGRRRFNAAPARLAVGAEEQRDLGGHRR
ncbi:endoglucanase [Enterobacter cancerogenus]|uniref:cellulase n=1 Tax=Enterobacter cancerogenus TaxID=69218 RepID=A0A484Z153_9ENTR|nr:endoglucanase [Enterobacter cancerogenus]